MKLARHFAFITLQESTPYYDVGLQVLTRSWAEAKGGRGRQRSQPPTCGEATCAGLRAATHIAAPS